MQNVGKQALTGLGVLLLSLWLPATGFALDFYPAEVEIEVLSDLYEGVDFNHELHVMLAECADCHHHTTGTGVESQYCGKCHDGTKEADTFACQGCHSADPMSAKNVHTPNPQFNFHDDIPNLKAAYHLNCLNCHREMGVASGCLDCHAKTESGQKFYHSGEYAPTGAEDESGH